MAKPVVVITGASSGIGRAAAQRFAAAGYRVFGTTRTPPAASEPGGIRTPRMDVRDGASVRACVDEILAEAGGVDVLVSNAGRIVFGPAEEVPLDDATNMFETNFWGAARVVNAILPSMRERRSGCIVFVGSIAATVPIPMNAFYAASKAALARYAEALRHETAHFGVRVALVEPGDVKTRFWDNAQVAPAHIQAYAILRERVLENVRPLLDAAPEPTPVAEAILAAAESEHPALLSRVGDVARHIAWMRAVMPASVFERGVRRRFGLEPAPRPVARSSA
jgi:NAD(P)-dependent dehydrogenase (short-subunit alcohol dehydrogenase family)